MLRLKPGTVKYIYIYIYIYLKLNLTLYISTNYILYMHFKNILRNFPDGPVVKDLLAKVGDTGLIPVWEDPTC